MAVSRFVTRVLSPRLSITFRCRINTPSDPRSRPRHHPHLVAVGLPDLRIERRPEKVPAEFGHAELNVEGRTVNAAGFVMIFPLSGSPFCWFCPTKFATITDR